MLNVSSVKNRSDNYQLIVRAIETVTRIRKRVQTLQKNKVIKKFTVELTLSNRSKHDHNSWIRCGSDKVVEAYNIKQLRASGKPLTGLPFAVGHVKNNYNMENMG